MRRQPAQRHENLVAYALDEIERLKSLVVRNFDGREIVAIPGSGGTSPVFEAGAHVLYGSKHTRSGRVTADTGLDVDFEQVQVWVLGVFYDIAAGSLTLTDNATNYVYVDNTG